MDMAAMFPHASMVVAAGRRVARVTVRGRRMLACCSENADAAQVAALAMELCNLLQTARNNGDCDMLYCGAHCSGQTRRSTAKAFHLARRVIGCSAAVVRANKC